VANRKITKNKANLGGEHQKDKEYYGESFNERRSIQTRRVPRRGACNGTEREKGDNRKRGNIKRNLPVCTSCQTGLKSGTSSWEANHGGVKRERSKERGVGRTKTFE